MSLILIYMAISIMYKDPHDTRIVQIEYAMSSIDIPIGTVVAFEHTWEWAPLEPKFKFSMNIQHTSRYWILHVAPICFITSSAVGMTTT